MVTHQHDKPITIFLRESAYWAIVCRSPTNSAYRMPICVNDHRREELRAEIIFQICRPHNFSLFYFISFRYANDTIWKVSLPHNGSILIQAQAQQGITRAHSHAHIVACQWSSRRTDGREKWINNAPNVFDDCKQNKSLCIRCCSMFQCRPFLFSSLLLKFLFDCLFLSRWPVIRQSMAAVRCFFLSSASSFWLSARNWQRSRRCAERTNERDRREKQRNMTRRGETK